MISHEHKVIFYHIPRTGGTTLEILFTNIDWAYINHKMKHPSLNELKNSYKKEWDDYDKITIIRNPFEWVRSLYTENRHLGVSFEKYCSDIKFDVRTNKGFMFENISGRTFDEILQNNFTIYRFEDLVKDKFNIIRNKYNISQIPSHSMSFHDNNKVKKPIHTKKTVEIIKTLFKKDLELYYPKLLHITYEEVIKQDYKNYI